MLTNRLIWIARIPSKNPGVSCKGPARFTGVMRILAGVAGIWGIPAVTLPGFANKNVQKKSCILCKAKAC